MEHQRKFRKKITAHNYYYQTPPPTCTTVLLLHTLAFFAIQVRFIYQINQRIKNLIWITYFEKAGLPRCLLLNFNERAINDEDSAVVVVVDRHHHNGLNVLAEAAEKSYGKATNSKRKSSDVGTTDEHPNKFQHHSIPVRPIPAKPVPKKNLESATHPPSYNTTTTACIMIAHQPSVQSAFNQPGAFYLSD